MNKLIIFALLAVSSRAFADPAPVPTTSPWGSSPYVVSYQPPPEVERAHRGLTLEIALGSGSTSLDDSAGCVTFAIGGWVSHDVALAFRVTDVGAYGFAGGSVQYFATPSLWAGGGLGSLSETTMDGLGYTTRTNGFGGFARAGYSLTSGAHSLYMSGELQAGSIAGETRTVALFAIGYQML